MLGPFEKEGGLKLPNLRHDRWRHGRHIGLHPHLVAGLGCMVTHAVKDFNTCMPLSQEDPEISTQLMPRRVRRSRRNPWEANSTGFYTPTQESLSSFQPRSSSTGSPKEGRGGLVAP